MNQLLLSSIILCLLSANALYASENNYYNRIHFTVQAEKTVAADEINATLSVQRIGPDIAKLSDQVNDAIKNALKIANRESNIKVETLNYQTNKHYQKGKQAGWQVSQSIALTGSDLEQISELIGKLQSQLQLNSINYRVSSELRKDIEDQLATEALNRFRQKAEKYSQTLGSSNYQIVEISLSGQGVSPPRPMMMTRKNVMMTAEAVSTPAIQPGDQKISVSASGSIELAD